jgi:hypothetical protein
MDCSPMPKKGIVIDRVNLLEEHRHFDALLVIWLGSIIQLRRVEIVLNLLPRHYGVL